MRSTGTTRFREAFFSEDLSGRIDREAGIIRDVRVLGRESLNGRRYSDKAHDDATTLYEGIKVNFDHSKGERKFSEGFGIMKSIRKSRGEVRGDLHYLKSHPAAELVLEAAERFPNSFGLSHDAGGIVSMKDGIPVVESIDKVYSVDIVGRPATNQGLFESENQTMTKEELTELKEQLREEIKADFEEEAKVVAKAEEEAAEAKRLKESKEKLPPSDNEIRLQEEIDGLKAGRALDQARADARKLLESSNIEATDPRIGAIVRCENDDDRKSLMEDLPKREKKSDRPDTSPPKFPNLSEGENNLTYDQLKESLGSPFGAPAK